jgi:hypothetical protein
VTLAGADWEATVTVYSFFFNLVWISICLHMSKVEREVAYFSADVHHHEIFYPDNF